jgi:hypothetical protein
LRAYYKDKVDGFEIGDDINVRDDDDEFGKGEGADWDDVDDVDDIDDLDDVDDFDDFDDEEGNNKMNHDDDDDDDDEEEEFGDEDEEEEDSGFDEKVHLGDQPKNIPHEFKQSSQDVNWKDAVRGRAENERSSGSGNDLGEWFKVKK